MDPIRVLVSLIGVIVTAYFALMLLFWLFEDGEDDHLR